MTPEERHATLNLIGVEHWRVPDGGLLEYDPVHDEWRVEVWRIPGPGTVIIRRYAGRKRPTTYLRVFPENHRARMPTQAEIDAWLAKIPPMAPEQMRDATHHLAPDFIGEPEPEFNREEFLRRHRQMMEAFNKRDDVRARLGRAR